MVALEVSARSDSMENCKTTRQNSLNSTESTHTKVPTTTYPTNSLQFLQRLIESQKVDNKADLQPLPAEVQLKIVIVGAGLGGLATAIALARHGHSVTVLEQAHQLGEVGAGIQIPPNSGRLLERWGVSQFLTGKASQPQGITFRRWQDGRIIGYTKLGSEFREHFRAPYAVVHRADFHEALYQRAIQLGVEVKVDCKVVAYDLEAPLVRLASGACIMADFIIAADGVKSTARQLILDGVDLKPEPTGFAAYRATVDVQMIEGHPDISWLIQKPALNVWIGENRHVMAYTIGSGKSLNMVLSHVDKSDPSTWKAETAIGDMRKEFTGWDPNLTKIINMIDRTIKWPLVSGSALPTWSSRSSKVLILGDAAHAMVPYMSQGAAMAVEDGAALATVLNLIRERSSLPFALAVFERERMRRTRGMQEASLINGILWHYKDGIEQEARDAAMSAETEGRNFLSSANQWSDPVTQWWAYGYDAEAEMKKAWHVAITELDRKSC